jgi:hypothetical protein
MVLASRWFGPLTIPVAITSPTCESTSGWVVEVRGGPVLRGAAIRCAIEAPGKGGCPVKDSYSTQTSE